MSKIKFIYFVVIIFFTQLGIGQELTTIKKLKAAIDTCKEDTIKVKKLIRLSYKLSNEDFKSSVTYANQALELSQKLKYLKGQIEANNCLADAHWFHSDYDKAQRYYFKSYRISDSIKDNKQIAFSLYNIGWIICIQQHNYKEDHYLYKSLNLYSAAKDSFGLLRIYNALGSYYTDRFNTENKAQYFDSSKTYFLKGITLAQVKDYQQELGMFYGNLGDLYFKAGQFSPALLYQNKSFEMHRVNEDSSSMMISLLNIGLCEIEINKIPEALKKLELVKNYNVRHEFKDAQMSALKGLGEGSYKLGNYQKAFDYYQQYMALKEVVDKEAYSTSISNLQSSFSLEKAEANVAQLKQSNEIQELKNKKKSYFIIGLLVLAMVVLTIAGLLLRQNKQKQLTNIQLQSQNYIIAEKKQEIDNSIQYAKGIQLALLPDKKELTNQFNQSFIYYRPKDVVSGDFYWFSKVGTDFYCIAADCTGHGVPGALMSIIGVDKIVQAVFEKKITSPSGILSYLNVEIKKVLKQHLDESKQKDGMDIALLKFSTLTNEVEFAGANRPLYVVRNNELIEYKSEKTAIAGFTPDDQEFSTTTVRLQKDDTLYIFTDGYADQFGGSDGKKMMTKNMKNMLLSIADLPAEEQYQKVKQKFLDWKQSYEQVDDVLVIGIKV